MKVLGALSHAGVGAAVGVSLGLGLGVVLGGAGGALGATIWQDTMLPPDGVARELGDLVSTAADMGLVGNGVLLGSIGLFAGAGSGLIKGGYISCNSLTDYTQRRLLEIFTAIAFAAPAVGGLIGQDLVQDRNDTVVSKGESALFSITGTQIIVLSLLCLAITGYSLFGSRCAREDGDQPSNSPTP